MKHTPLRFIMLLLGGALLTGCCAQQQASQSKPEPTIVGDWSEPVNGVRIAARYLASNASTDDVMLLILAENVTDHAIDWPGIRPEESVRFAGEDPSKGYHSWGRPNLRIVAERLDGQPKRALLQMQKDQLLERAYPLRPREIHLQAIRLHDPEMLSLSALTQADTSLIYIDDMLWPGVNDHDARGLWRLRLTYRPEGFPPAPGEERAEVDLEEIKGWEGVEIELPPLTIHREPPGRQQINRFRN